LAMLFYNQRQHVHLHGFWKQVWGCIFSLDVCAWGNISLCPCASQVDTTKDIQEHWKFHTFLWWKGSSLWQIETKEGLFIKVVLPPKYSIIVNGCIACLFLHLFLLSLHPILNRLCLVFHKILCILVWDVFFDWHATMGGAILDQPFLGWGGVFGNPWRFVVGSIGVVANNTLQHLHSLKIKCSTLVEKGK
jgi:hypothetical protein